ASTPATRDSSAGSAARPSRIRAIVASFRSFQVAEDRSRTSRTISSSGRGEALSSAWISGGTASAPFRRSPIWACRRAGGSSVRSRSRSASTLSPDWRSRIGSRKTAGVMNEGLAQALDVLHELVFELGQVQAQLGPDQLLEDRLGSRAGDLAAEVGIEDLAV